jgi:predicted small secreted protein
MPGNHPGTRVAAHRSHVARRCATHHDRGDSTMKRLIWAVLAAAVLAGCNTMHGLGEDIERGGEKLQNSADKKK